MRMIEREFLAVASAVVAPDVGCARLLVHPYTSRELEREIQCGNSELNLLVDAILEAEHILERLLVLVLAL